MNKKSSMSKSKKTYEYHGATVEEAIKKALEDLNVPRETISVKIVSEEKKGLFGMEGEKLAKIKVEIKDEEC